MRRNGFLTVLTVVNLGLFAALLLSAAPTNPTDTVAPSVVRAQAIELVDAAGNVRAQLYLGTDGAGNLRLRNAKGEVRVKLGAQDDGAGLLFLDKNTEPAVQLKTGQADTSLTLTDLEKKQRVVAP